VLIIVKVRTQWAQGHDSACHGLGEPYRPHTRPIRGIAKRLPWSPCGPAEICNLLTTRNINLLLNTKVIRILFSNKKRVSVELTPNVMNIVQSSDLRKESGKCLVVMLAIVDGTGPVVSPFNHGARGQSV